MASPDSPSRLFLPQIDADLSLSPTVSGLISGGSFLGYCIAIVLSAYLTERIGARAVVVGAALIAAVGMIGIAISSSSLWLAIAVMLAGSSTGLASPPMAAAVAAAVRPDRQSATNTIINAGASAGGLPPLTTGIARLIAASFVIGASYIMLTGVYLVWGVSALPDRPATGLMIGLLTIAIGRTGEDELAPLSAPNSDRMRKAACTRASFG